MEGSTSSASGSAHSTPRRRINGAEGANGGVNDDDDEPHEEDKDRLIQHLEEEVEQQVPFQKDF